MEPHAEWMHCIADNVFFDSPDRIDDTASRFAAADRPVPPGWRRGEGDLWVGLEAPFSAVTGTPSGAEGAGPADPESSGPGSAITGPPVQGWKIHVSVTMTQAARCLDIVWDYCVDNGLSFKFLRSTDAMLILNAKYAGRGSSGKFVTMYPRDENQLGAALGELSERLTGVDGPYVLGDVRIGAGPLYVRYGGFAEMWCRGEGDEPVLAIENHRGERVPDRRGPVFLVPDGVAVPEVLRPHLEARRRQAGDDFPYQVEEALHFSNGGGVYLARDRVGRRVVLREARPHAGLDRHRTDAVTRLRHEYATLNRLAGLDCVPAVIDYRIVQGHHFLVEENVDGMTLLRAIQSRSPAMYPETLGDDGGDGADGISREVAEYRDWAVAVLGRVTAALSEVHARGVRFGDLNPANILLRPDGRVVFVDFEFATDLTNEAPPGLGAPGFIAPPGAIGTEVDLYALASLRLFAFMMVTPMVDLAPEKVTTLVKAAREVAGMPAQFGLELTRLRARLKRREARGSLGSGTRIRKDDAARMFDVDEVSWPSVRDSLVNGIHHSATPDRPDRLFPGSPAQFRTGGFDLAYGAAGVLFALHRVGAKVPDEYVEWLIRATKRAPLRPCQGLYNGPHGVAWLLDLIGRRDDALDILELAGIFDRLPSSDTLYAGNAGRALNLLRFARMTDDDSLRMSALRLGEDVADRFADGVRPSGYGLLRGATGAALLFIHLFVETGASRCLDIARQLLQHDLDQGTRLDDRSFQLRIGSRYVPYLDGGGGGLALVMGEYLRYREDPQLTTIMAGIRRSCAVPMVFQPGLFTGRAGFVAILRYLGSAEDQRTVRDHVRRFAWHAVSHNGDLAFPGEQLLRLSMDVATGAAGVLLALHAAFEDARAFLPYLDTREFSQDAVLGSSQGESHRSLATVSERERR